MSLGDATMLRVSDVSRLPWPSIEQGFEDEFVLVDVRVRMRPEFERLKLNAIRHGNKIHQKVITHQKTEPAY